MARTLTFTGEMRWPLEDGQQAAKLPLAASLDYTEALYIENVYPAPVADEAIALPMASAKFLLIEAGTEDVDVKLNGNANAITIKADVGFVLIWNEDGAVTALTITVPTAPATFRCWAFA